MHRHANEDFHMHFFFISVVRQCYSERQCDATVPDFPRCISMDLLNKRSHHKTWHWTAVDVSGSAAMAYGNRMKTSTKTDFIFDHTRQA